MIAASVHIVAAAQREGAVAELQRMAKKIRALHEEIRAALQGGDSSGGAAYRECAAMLERRAARLEHGRSKKRTKKR